MCVFVCGINACMCVFVWDPCMYVCVCMCVRVEFVHVCVCACVYLSVSMFEHTFAHTWGEEGRKINDMSQTLQRGDCSNPEQPPS